jgi:hypothetical protein
MPPLRPGARPSYWWPTARLLTWLVSTSKAPCRLVPGSAILTEKMWALVSRTTQHRTDWVSVSGSQTGATKTKKQRR